MTTFTAAFPGDCDSCGGQVKGTECEFNLSGYIQHVRCPDQPTVLNRPACPACFLELPVSGVCGECV